MGDKGREVGETGEGSGGEMGRELGMWYPLSTPSSKVHPACHSIVNGIKPGSKSKKTDKHAADCSKAVCWGVK